MFIHYVNFIFTFFVYIYNPPPAPGNVSQSYITVGPPSFKVSDLN
jgi:hypothetical protein